MQSNLTDKQILLLENWSEKVFNGIIYDTEIDKIERFDTSFQFQHKVTFVKTFYIIIETDDDIIFGFYFGQELIKQSCCFRPAPPNRVKDSFAFTFKDDNPMKFDKRDDVDEILVQRTNELYYIIGCKTIGIQLFQESNVADGKNNEEYFFKGLEHPLVGREKFTVKRLMIIDMKEKSNDQTNKNKLEKSFCSIC